VNTLNKSSGCLQRSDSRLWRHWSESKLKRLHQCPLAFRFAYVDKISVPQGVEKVFGGAIHWACKMFFRPKMGYETPQKFLNTFIHFWQGVCEGRHGQDGFNRPQIEIRFRKPKQDYLGLGINLLRSFYEINQPYLEGSFLPRPELLEKTFAFRFRGFPLRVRWDRLQPASFDAQENHIIYDYKTGLSEPGAIEQRFDLQFTFYSLAYLKRFGRPPAGLALWLLQSQGGKTIEIPARSQEHYLDLALQLEEAARFVEGALLPDSAEKTCLLARQTAHYYCLPPMPQPHFIRIEGPQCRYCDFDAVCAEFALDDFRNPQVLRELENIRPDSEVIQLAIPGLKVKRQRRHPTHRP